MFQKKFSILFISIILFTIFIFFVYKIFNIWEQSYLTIHNLYQNKYIITENQSYIITGNVSKIKEIYLNGQKLNYNLDGFFSQPLILFHGNNIINFHFLTINNQWKNKQIVIYTR